MEPQKSNLNINPLILIALLFQLLFMIFAFISIKNLIEQDNLAVAEISIDNISSTDVSPDNNTISGNAASDLNDTQKSAVERVLFQTIALNTPAGQNIPNFGAEIRDGSVINTYLEDFDAHILNFIVDIDELGQSYRVVYRWADDYPNKVVPANNPAMVLCLPDRDLVYDDFNCQDEYSGNGDDQIVYDLLRSKLFSNFTAGVTGDVQNGEPLNIKINTLSDDESVKSAAVAEVAEYLESLGFNLSDYEYSVNSYECCGVD